MENNNFDNYNDQFVVSHELVQLMRWIVQHNPEGLKKVVEVATSREKKSKLKAKEDFVYVDQDLHLDLLEFFGLMELFLYETEQKQIEQKIIQKSVLPSAQRIDTTLCDQLTVNSCAAIATSQIDEKNSDTVFLKELLKRWKPLKENCN